MEERNPEEKDEKMGCLAVYPKSRSSSDRDLVLFMSAKGNLLLVLIVHGGLRSDAFTE